MGDISQVKSQGAGPVTIRKVLRSGHGYAVTLPRSFIATLPPDHPKYLAVQEHADGYVTIRPLAAVLKPHDVPNDPPGPH